MRPARGEERDCAPASLLSRVHMDFHNHSMLRYGRPACPHCKMGFLRSWHASCPTDFVGLHEFDDSLSYVQFMTILSECTRTTSSAVHHAPGLGICFSGLRRIQVA